MMRRTFFRLSVFGLVLLAVISTFAALAAANTVPSSRAGNIIADPAITANDLKPTSCAALNLTVILTGSGTINGSGSNELILGSAGVDTINGRGGNDCILGGGGNDALRGGGGTDLCDGGPGTDTADATCETQLNIP